MMISYIKPELPFMYLVKSFIKHRARAKMVLEKLRIMGARVIYVRNKQRYALLCFLEDIGWKNKKILVPAYTCSSVAHAVEASGNHALFYDIKKNFQIDIESVKRVARNGVDAVIISDIYGINLDISSWLRETQHEPLIIGDFAHHESITFDKIDRPYFDVVMYSSAYYKPIPSSGIGILVVISDKIRTRDSILIDYSWAKAAYETILLYGIDRLLSSFTVKYIYSFVTKSESSETIINTKDKYLGPSSVALSQILQSANKKYVNRGNINHFYRNSLPSLDFIENCSENMTYTSILVDPSKILNIHQGALRKGVLLGCIFQNIAGKNEKMCPTANFISRRVLNLPYLRITNVEDKKRVVKVLQEIIDLK